MLFLSRLFSEPAFLFDGIEGGKMYFLKTEQSFDSAHFLAGYHGKCANIHGHRWKVIATIKSEKLLEDPQNKGMVTDFGDLKKDLKIIADSFDHALIIETGSLSEKLYQALIDENFKIINLPFRPTPRRSFEKSSIFLMSLASPMSEVFQIRPYESKLSTVSSVILPPLFQTLLVKPSTD